jgi:hypothetical protein
MKILLAPAETKQQGGELPPINLDNFQLQKPIIDEYEQFISVSSIEELSKWFGLKDLGICGNYKRSIKNLPTLKAIQRYTGIAFDAIDYNHLNDNAQNFIDKNVIIFSNLFGYLQANTPIPDYKFKQGATLPNINNEKFYKEHLKDILDKTLDDEVLDLRATFYNKIYKPIAPTITYKFLLNGKVVSHWAKHYRGELVKQIAQNNIESFAELMNFKFKNLSLVEIQEKKNIKTIIMAITN